MFFQWMAVKVVHWIYLASTGFFRERGHASPRNVPFEER